MKKLPTLIFLFLLTSALCSSVCGYKQTETYINKDVNNALAMTLKRMPCDVVSADTIKCYREFITINEIRDTASIAMRSIRKNRRQKTELIAEAGCGFFTVFGMSDQRSSGAIMIVALLWLIGSSVYAKRHRSELMAQGIAFGGITFNNNHFCAEHGEEIRFTPMQHELMGMFFLSEEHTLSKQDVCNRLWPKKPDASDTLYTLIRRLKPILEKHSQLKIESNRGKSYTLKDSRIG
jgi:hypothetical protein